MDVPQWTVELHAHTIYSKDSLVRLEALQEICRAQSIDRLFVTDHNTASGALQAARLYPMLVIAGEEVMTTKGELLGWFVQETVPPGLSPQETIERFRSQEAVIGVPHPFDSYRRGAWQLEDLLEIVEDVDAIEVFNARCLKASDNQQALAFAQEYGKLMTAGSDAHIPSEYGRAVIQVPPFASTADGFRQALGDATRVETLSNFLVHFGSTYAKWVKRLRPSLRPE